MVERRKPPQERCDMIAELKKAYPPVPSYVIGSASTASQPVRSVRLASCSTPPWASAICRLRICCAALNRRVGTSQSATVDSFRTPSFSESFCFNLLLYPPLNVLSNLLVVLNQGKLLLSSSKLLNS
jgi:hypothetical protein